MPTDKRLAGFTRASAERIARAVRMVEGQRGGDVPSRRRRLVMDGDGGATAAIIGTVAVAAESVPEPEEMTVADLPEAVQDAIDDFEEIAETLPCWKLGKGEGTLYQLVGHFEEDELQDIYMVPVANAETRLLYNSAGAVGADRPLQVKFVTMTSGNVSLEVPLIDVEKCS